MSDFERKIIFFKSFLNGVIEQQRQRCDRLKTGTFGGNHNSKTEIIIETNKNMILNS